MAAEAYGIDLIPAVALLGAGVVAVPIFRSIGLGSVLGYLVAGIAIGPFGVGLFQEPHAILNVAELGVVMLLFIIGLELKPSRLWSLRRDIFGLGLAQVLLSAGLLMLAALALGLRYDIAIIAAMGLALSSTAVVLQILEERGETTDPHGQKTFSILLLQDLAIVPFLAVLAFLAPGAANDDAGPHWLELAAAAAAVFAVIAAGRWLLNPMFRVLAAAGAREILTAAALLVVLGAALTMQAGGLSMAMGSFLAGVLLSESTFRHQLEADIEPFRGLLLGLFFLGVGMSLDLSVIAAQWPIVLAMVAAFMLVKTVAIYGVARVFGSGHSDALRIALLLAEGGEFAFVLFSTAGGLGLLDSTTAAVLNAAVIVSMALTPLAPFAVTRLLPAERESFEGVEIADGLSGTALLIGFGRFGQMVSQPLLARGIDVAIIDNDTEMIRAAARFGFKIYYGDGTRLDVLRAAGAGRVKIIAVCVDRRDAANRIVELVRAEFPIARLLVRAYDRGHTLDLIDAGVDYQIRETFESAIAFGAAALREFGVPQEEVAELIAGVRARDAERLEIQQAEGIFAGRGILKTQPTPTPLTRPKRESQPLSEETAVVAAEQDGGPDAAPSDQ
jgi:glutathione-regulated potassium-efflux system protein KefB